MPNRQPLVPITSCNHCKSSIQFWRLTSMQNSRSHWSHREPRLISKWLLRMMIVLYALCLLPLLTGCGSTRTVYVPIPAVPLPASLTTETPQPVIPEPLTYGASWDNAILTKRGFEVSRCAVTLCWQQSNSPNKEQEYIYAPSNSKSLPRSRLP